MDENAKIQGSKAPADVAVGDPGSVPVPHRYRSAFERALPASQVLEVDELIPINIDVPTAIALTAGKLPGIMALRDRAKELPGFDVSAFDELETHVLATGHAHIRYMGASAEPEAILELNERGLRLRNTLYADAVALATRNLISGDRLGDFKAAVGYKNLAFDLMALASILRDNWDKISSKTAITPDDLDQAELIGDQLVSAVGSREETPASVAEITVQRQRNFTLFLKAYDEVRRAVAFLRWREDDAERIAPSLYAGRGNSNARKKGGDTQPDTDQTPANPLGGPSASGTPGAGAPAPGAAHSADGGTHTTTSPAAPAGTAAPSTAVGLPGSVPFVS